MLSNKIILFVMGIYVGQICLELKNVFFEIKKNLVSFCFSIFCYNNNFELFQCHLCAEKSQWTEYLWNARRYTIWTAFVDGSQCTTMKYFVWKYYSYWYTFKKHKLYTCNIIWKKNEYIYVIHAYSIILFLPLTKYANLHISTSSPTSEMHRLHHRHHHHRLHHRWAANRNFL